MNEKCDELLSRRLTARTLGDSDMNIMQELRHEACETHCEDCGRCITNPAAEICEGCE